MDYQIETNVQVPRVYGRGRPPVYPFGNMDIGNSFALKPEDDLGRVRSAACWYGKRNGMKFAVRRDDPVKQTYRCWRIA